MTKKLLWTIAIVAITAYLLFWHCYVRPFDFSDFIESIGFLSTFFTVLIFAAILGLLIALFPFRLQKYRKKLRATFPISIILVCIIFGLTFYSNGPHYAAIKSDIDANCQSVHDGIFQSGQLRIERKGNQQIQTNIKTNEKENLSVTWLSDCEYQLTTLNEIVKVKIVSVDQNGYDCFVWQHGRTSRLISVK